ncbi:hypothetical protein SAVIM338S_06505 [Streptomyces avidinii]
MDDEQGGAGGVPLHHDDHGDHNGRARAPQREPRADRRGGDPEDGGKTAAADTDEASRLDRPQGTRWPEDPHAKVKGRTTPRWVGPQDKSTETATETTD